MTTKDEALKQALAAMQQIHPDYHLMPGRIGPQAALLNLHTAIAACREALAQNDEHAPVAWKWRRHALDKWICVGFWDALEAAAANEMETCGKWDVVRLYAAPPPRKPLTDEQVIHTAIDMGIIDSLNDPYEQVEGDPVSSIKIDIVKLVRAVEKAHGIGVEK